MHLAVHTTHPGAKPPPRAAGHSWGQAQAGRDDVERPSHLCPESHRSLALAQTQPWLKCQPPCVGGRHAGFCGDPGPGGMGMGDAGGGQECRRWGPRGSLVQALFLS